MSPPPSPLTKLGQTPIRTDTLAFDLCGVGTVIGMMYVKIMYMDEHVLMYKMVSST
jgi:hypothetical protein